MRFYNIHISHLFVVSNHCYCQRILKFTPLKNQPPLIMAFGKIKKKICNIQSIYRQGVNRK